MDFNISLIEWIADWLSLDIINYFTYVCMQYCNKHYRSIIAIHFYVKDCSVVGLR